MKSNPVPRTFRFLATPLALAAAFAAHAGVEDTINKSFEVAPGGQLTMKVDRGSIEIVTAAASKCEFTVKRKAKEQKTLDDHEITFTQDGNNVSVSAKMKTKAADSWFGPNLQVHYRVTVPENFNADVNTAGGSITVTGLHGKTKARTSGGSMTFKRIEGPLDAHTSGGSVTVAGCKGVTDIKTSGGSLTLSDITGDLTAKTSGGSITCERLTGASVVHTSGGSITISEITGKIEAATSGGSIRAALNGQPTGDCSFKTSGGSVTLKLAENINAELDAATSAGRVTSELTVEPPQDPKHKSVLRGRLNAGGPKITARSSAGSVHIEKGRAAK